jgi:hypothetical protein
MSVVIDENNFATIDLIKETELARECLPDKQKK